MAEPYLLGLMGLGLPHTADATRAKQAEVVLARLREIKRARDPHNVFRANYPVLGDRAVTGAGGRRAGG